MVAAGWKSCMSKIDSFQDIGLWSKASQSSYCIIGSQALISIFHWLNTPKSTDTLSNCSEIADLTISLAIFTALLYNDVDYSFMKNKNKNKEEKLRYEVSVRQQRNTFITAVVPKLFFL